MASGNPEGVGDLLFRNVDHFRELLTGRHTLVFLLELSECLVYLVQGTYLIQRQTYYAGLLREGLEYGLAYPPDCIRNEFESSRLIEFLGRLDQSEVALVDKVREAQALVLVLFCHGYHEPQVCSREFLQGRLVALPNALGELDLLLYGDEFFPADLLEIFVQRRTLPVGDRLCNLKLPH